MRSPPDPQKENPDSLAGETGVQGIEALPRKIDRYGKAKRGALDVANYMATIPDYAPMARKVQLCGEYLVFRHYYTIDKVRLHGASLCKKHLLCPLCAIRRGAKSLKAYLDRFQRIKAAKPHLKPFLVTLTVKDGDDLEERFKHLHKSQKELWKRRSREYSTVLDNVEGAVWSYEIKRGANSGKWHPHLHMIALAESMPDQKALSAEWHNITGDSFIVDVRPISQEDPATGFVEVFKYAVKFSDQPPEDTVHAWETLAGKRLLGSAGCFRGVEVPEGLLDDSEGFEGLPYIELFYRYLPVGYSLQRRSEGTDFSPRRTQLLKPPAPKTERNHLQDAIHHRLMDHALAMRWIPGSYAEGMKAKRKRTPA